MIRVLINGENRNDYLKHGVCRIQKDLGEPWTCELQSVSLNGEIETITGDGVSRQFQLSRIPANIPALFLGGTEPLNVGIYGVDTGKDWYWEVGTRNIYEDDLSVTIPDGSILTADLGTWYPSVGQTVQVQVAHEVSYEVTGDGVATEWELPQTARELLSLVANDSLPQTFGILGVDSGKQYYLDPDNNTLVADPSTGALPNGDTLDIGYDYWVTVFGGIIRQVARKKPAKGESPLLMCDVTCTDYNYILERRVVGEREWIGVTDVQIAQDIFDNDLTGEGLALYTGEESPSQAVDIASFRTAYDTANGAFAALANLSGKRFWIDGGKTLNYITPTSSAAPFDIASGAVNIHDMHATETDEEYCNYVVVKSAQTLREPQTETFDGDSALTSFELAYPVGQVPTITLDGETQTVGIWGVDAGRDWYWNQGSKEIRQDEAATPISGTLSVTYSGVESAYLVAKDDAEISRRAAIEGSSGQYMKFFEIDRLLSQADAQAVAQGILESRYTVPLKVWYRTSDYIEPEAKNLQPGQTQNILFEGFASQQNDYVVRSISMNMWALPDTADYHFDYEVEAYYGAVAKTTFQWFKELAGSGPTAGSGGSGAQAIETEYFHFFLGGCEAVAAGEDVAAHRPHAHKPGRIYQLSSDCKTPPTGEDLVFNVLRSDDNSTWASLSASGSFTHPQGEDQVFFTDFASDNNIAVGTKFRVDVTSGGAAEGWAIKIASKLIQDPPGELQGDNIGDSQTNNVPTVL